MKVWIAASSRWANDLKEALLDEEVESEIMDDPAKLVQCLVRKHDGGNQEVDGIVIGETIGNVSGIDSLWQAWQKVGSPKEGARFGLLILATQIKQNQKVLEVLKTQGVTLLVDSQDIDSIANQTNAALRSSMRSSERAAVSWDASLAIGDQVFAGEIKDLSVGGGRLHGKNGSSFERMQIGTTGIITIVPANDEEFTSDVTVRWKKSYRRLWRSAVALGLMFDELSDPLEARIDAMIKHLIEEKIAVAKQMTHMPFM